jgi:hypothetical protein
MLLLLLLLLLWQKGENGQTEGRLRCKGQRTLGRTRPWAWRCRGFSWCTHVKVLGGVAARVLGGGVRNGLRGYVRRREFYMGVGAALLPCVTCRVW